MGCAEVAGYLVANLYLPVGQGERKFSVKLRAYPVCFGNTRGRGRRKVLESALQQGCLKQERLVVLQGVAGLLPLGLIDADEAEREAALNAPIEPTRFGLFRM